MKVEVFDPPMCCASGVCGPEIDPALVRFAAELETLRARGVEVARYGLAHEPLVFARYETVRAALQKDAHCLPLVLVNGCVVSQGAYPASECLAPAIGEHLPETDGAAAPAYFEIPLATETDHAG